MKERFEMFWYVVSLSLIPPSLMELISLIVDNRKPLGLLSICIVMFVLRWLLTGRHFHIPFTKPNNIIIGVFFVISAIFWELLYTSLYY